MPLSAREMCKMLDFLFEFLTSEKNKYIGKFKICHLEILKTTPSGRNRIPNKPIFFAKKLGY